MMNRTLHGFVCILGTILLVGILVACGGSSGITQSVQTDHYTIQLTLDGVRFGERTATIDVRDRSGSPVTADQVVLSPVMPQMGMASPEMTAQLVALGRYQARGEFFSMIGEWNVDVRVSAGGNEEVATFKVEATQ